MVWYIGIVGHCEDMQLHISLNGGLLEDQGGLLEDHSDERLSRGTTYNKDDSLETHFETLNISSIVWLQVSRLNDTAMEKHQR